MVFVINPTELFKESHALKLGAGEVLFREGEIGNKMYMLLKGEMEILFQGVLLEAASPGALIGEMALIDNNPRSATVIAKTDCQLSEIDQTRFLSLIQQTPSFGLHVMKVMANRLRYMNITVANQE